MTVLQYRAGIFLAALLMSSPVGAHHAFFAVYDPQQIVEIEGEVVSLAWRNPHILLTIRTDGSDDPPVVWRIEGNAKSMLVRMGVTEGLVNEGDHVRLAGNPARRGRNQLFVTNILLADGLELVTRPLQSARWSERALGPDSAWLRDGTAYDSQGEDPGIFRVWSTNLAERDSFPIWNRGYPLTDSARTALDTWKRNAHVILDCKHYGMPTIMASPFPVEFVDHGDVILLRIESFNAERAIHMLQDTRTSNRKYTPLGYSNGSWEQNTLVVRTTNIDWHHFDQSGIAQGEDVSIVERITPGEDGSRLHYELTITDPATFTEPVLLDKYWVWRPDETVRDDYSYDDDCVR